MHPIGEHQKQSQRNLSLHPVSKLLLSCFYRVLLWLWVSSGKSYARSICSIFPLYFESNALKKSTNKSVASRFLARTFLRFDIFSESVMWWIGFSGNRFDSFKEFSEFLVRCGWFAGNYKSPSPWKKGLCLCSSWLFRGHLSWGKGECCPLSISLLCSGYIRRCSIRAVSHRITLSSIHLVVFHQDQLLACF